MENKVCKILGIKKPVIAAAMTWITNAEFVAAVSNAGGAGVIGFNAGVTEAATDPVVAAENLRKQIRKVKELTDKPFGVNIMIAPQLDPFTQATLDVFETDRPDFVLALPIEPANPEIYKRLKELDIKIVSRPMNSTVENMIAAEKAGADVLICTGSEEGGHAPEINVSLISRFPEIKKAVSIPLMAAGGIADFLAAKAVCAMGADGIYAGTRFIVSKENPAAQSVKEKIIDTKAEELIHIPANPGYLYLVPNATSLECKKMESDGKSREEISAYYSQQGSFRTGMLLGNQDEGFINCSQAINVITDIKTCKEIVDELAEPFES